MTIDEDIFQDVQQSFSRCASHGAFFERFQANFKAAHVSLSPFPGRQSKSLKEDLTQLMHRAADPELAGRAGAAALQVPTQLSRFWIDALMLAVREFDGKFTPELERKWRLVLQQGLGPSQGAGATVRLPASGE